MEDGVEGLIYAEHFHYLLRLYAEQTGALPYFGRLADHCYGSEAEVKVEDDDEHHTGDFRVVGNRTEVVGEVIVDAYAVVECALCAEAAHLSETAHIAIQTACIAGVGVPEALQEWCGVLAQEVHLCEYELGRYVQAYAQIDDGTRVEGLYAGGFGHVELHDERPVIV